jgi:dephospho-CoA kinase
MNSQLDAEYFASHSDYVIENNDTLEALDSISREVSDKIKYYYYHIRSAEMSVL